MPASIASAAEAKTRRSPASTMCPLVGRSMPKSTRAISVRPLPTSPPMPRISPAWRSNDTSSNAPSRPSCSTSSTTGPAGGASAGYRSASGRPIISRTARSCGMSATGATSTMRAVAQHRHAVRHAVDLLHAVAHEHHRHAAGAQLGHNLEQPVDLARGQRGGGLVHDQDASLHRQRARHFHQLLLRAAQPAERRARRARQAHGLEQALGLGMHAAMVERAERALELPPHEQVLGHREIGEQSRVLVHHGDAHALGIERRAQRDRLAADVHLAARGLVHAGEQLHAGALARAVLAQQGQHLAGHQVEGCIAQRDRAAELLGDAAQSGHAAGAPREGRRKILHGVLAGCGYAPADWRNALSLRYAAGVIPRSRRKWRLKFEMLLNPTW
jgi:hypothetical protein